jgi:hypothetical protein
MMLDLLGQAASGASSSMPLAADPQNSSARSFTTAGSWSSEQL